jgi:hypothetical protein
MSRDVRSLAIMRSRRHRDSSSAPLSFAICGRYRIPRPPVGQLIRALRQDLCGRVVTMDMICRQSERRQNNFRLATAVYGERSMRHCTNFGIPKLMPWAPNIALTSETVPCCSFKPLAAALATCTLMPVATDSCQPCFRRNASGNIKCTRRKWLLWFWATSCFSPCSSGCFDSARWSVLPEQNAVHTLLACEPGKGISFFF